MLAPTATTTTTMAFRLVGSSAQRAALMSSFAKTKAAQPAAATSTLTPFKTQSAPMSILARPTAFSCLRNAASSTTTTTASTPALTLLFRRSASTASSTSNSASSSAGTDQRLDWNTFFKLRKTRRRWQVAFSVVTMSASAYGGAVWLSTGVADPLLAHIPVTPFFALGIVVVAFAGLGWLAGPSLGSAVFNAMNRQWKPQMTMKEVEFFHRVKRNRVDPSASGASNPVPDYYGEKISSVSGYRQWLKDQRAFNKKRTKFV